MVVLSGGCQGNTEGTEKAQSTQSYLLFFDCQSTADRRVDKRSASTDIMVDAALRTLTTMRARLRIIHAGKKMSL